MPNSRLVYSTDSGRICPQCGKATAACTCKKKKSVPPRGYKIDGIIRIQRETKRRKGRPLLLYMALIPPLKI